MSVLNYYIETKDRHHLPEAYYYAGRVCRDLGDVPQALDYFEKALDVVEESGEYSLKGRIYSQMGTLFMYQDMCEEAADKFAEAYRYDLLQKDTAGMIFDLRDVAVTWGYMDKPDSALHYYREAYGLAKKHLQGSLEK